MTVLVGVLIAVAAFALILAASAIRILRREYERGVIFRLGRLIDQKGPGLILLIPIIDRMVRVDLRTVTLNIPPQEVITHDNVPARVNAVAYFRVVDANDAVVEVEDYLTATSQISQTTLRLAKVRAALQPHVRRAQAHDDRLAHRHQTWVRRRQHLGDRPTPDRRCAVRWHRRPVPSTRARVLG